MSSESFYMWIVRLGILNKNFFFHQIFLFRNSWQLPIMANNVLKLDLIIWISPWTIYCNLFSHCFSIYVKWCSQSDLFIIPGTCHVVSLLHILIPSSSPFHCAECLLLKFDLNATFLQDDGREFSFSEFW